MPPPCSASRTSSSSRRTASRTPSSGWRRPARTDHDATYLLAVWRPAFTEFLSAEVRRLAAIARARAGDGTPEWPMGAVIAAALRAGLHVDSVRFEEGRFLDIGTPHGLIAAAE